MKQRRIFAASLIALCACLCLAACGGKASGYELLESGECIVAVKASETNEQVSLFDVLLRLREEGEIEFTYSDSEYGAYILSVNGYTPDVSKNEYWAVYTTLGEYKEVSYSSAEYGTYDYNGTACASASYGVSGLPMVEGNVYLLAIGTY